MNTEQEVFSFTNSSDAKIGLNFTKKGWTKKNWTTTGVTHNNIAYTFNFKPEDMTVFYLFI